jgi:uncharacterized protein
MEYKMGQLLSQLPSLSFILDEDSGEVQASWVPLEGQAALDRRMLREALIEAGFGEFRFEEEAMADFVAAAESASDVITMIVANRGGNGEFSIAISEDLMSVSLTIDPPQGGKPVSSSSIMQALSERGIIHGILHDRLNAAIATGQCENLVIASGDKPQEGTPTRFESLLVDKRKELTQKDELAVIDYADLGNLLLVNPGDQLMRRIPAVQGKEGIDIKGQVVPVEALEDKPFGDKIQGAAPDPQDPNLLVAIDAGRPTLMNDGVTVNQVVQVANVDLSTGNIDFEGALHITGDIKAGMKVKAGGDVIVHGMVEAAEISAGGNVTVKGGIVGNASTLGSANTTSETVTKIRCKGSLHCLFMEYVHVEAEGTIIVERSIRQCELVAGEEIKVGKPGSKAGQIIGGRVQATNKVTVAVLGSPNGIKTFVQVGTNPFLAGQIAANEKMRETKMNEMDRVIKLIAYFKRDPAKAAGGVGEKVEATRQQLAADIEQLQLEQKQLVEKNAPAEQSSVQVTNTVHEGAEIRIGKHTWAARSDGGAGTARLYDDSIVFGR